MKRMSRAGRKAYICNILEASYRANKKAYFTVGQIAKRMGLKSSTYLKNVLRELSDEDERIIHLQQGGMDMWRFQPYRQTSFFSRGMKINGSLVAVNDFYDRLQSESK